MSGSILRSAALVLLLLADDTATSARKLQSLLTCDVVIGTTCRIQNDQVFRGQVSITPSNLNGANTANVEHLEVATGKKLTCFTPLNEETPCQLAFGDFTSITVKGTIEGSDIEMTNMNLINITSTGHISGDGLGSPAGQGPGAGKCTSRYCDRFAAASHGGVGGDLSCAKYSTYISPNPLYGSEENPDKLGSGGPFKSYGVPYDVFGGGRSRLEAMTLVLDGILSANANECGFSESTTTRGNTRQCATGAGGSILIRTPTLSGSGTIQANGGDVTSHSIVFASGGGGRIALYTNVDPATTQLTIQAIGGKLPNAECPTAFGAVGTIHKECLSSANGCSGNGVLDADGCGCKCNGLWEGGDCSVCGLTTCENGGVVDPATCTCSCTGEWMGDHCEQCQADALCNGHGTCSNIDKSCSCHRDYFGDKCETYCNSRETCGAFGSCTEAGTCECSDGRAGDSCSCFAQDCTLGTSACSGSGTCSNNECFCQAGYSGCSCERFCVEEVTCSGNGRCLEDASCECHPGFRGDSCDEQDPVAYCESGQTISGFPCLPGVIDVLGFGLDATSGETTVRIVPLFFRTGDTFKFGNATYELPDGVQCFQVIKTVDEFLTKSFQNSHDFRMDRASSFDLSTDFRLSFLSASKDYSTALQEGFFQERDLYTSDLSHGLFECTIQDTTSVEVSSTAKQAVREMEGTRLVRNIGTHYVRGAVFGGRITVFTFVERCVASTLTESQIKAKVDAQVFGIAAFGSAGGSVGSTVQSECSVFASHSFFRRTIYGGKRELLIIPGADSVSDLRDWFASLNLRPGAIQIRVNPVDDVLAEVEEDVAIYLDAKDEAVIERELTDIVPDAIDECTTRCEEEEDDETSGTQSHHWNVNFWYFTIIIAVFFAFGPQELLQLVSC